MRYLVTGHTGFKGSWLVAMLKMQGHEVHGIALRPENTSHFSKSKITKFLDSNTYLDIRLKEELTKKVAEISPEVVIHLAAQPLVRYSYRFPVETYETNVIGTLNLLEAIKNLQKLKAALIITTDKVYKNKNQMTGYLESDELGGDDPYSSSKAAADIASQSWRKSFGTFPLAIARAGNVIGGGDWSEDRLIPDIVESIKNDSPLILRNPKAVRPWQHVLDCLNGYQMLINKQLNRGVNDEWNFGPKLNDVYTVHELATKFLELWQSTLEIKIVPSEVKESNLLLLNSNKSRRELTWTEKLDFESTVRWTVDWYQHPKPEEITLLQLEKFLKL